MTQLAENGSLELEVTDFGPIVEAKVDLRPLTVFVGPSNTGKSYLAILIYALHQIFGGDARLGGSRFRGGSVHWTDRLGRGLSDKSVDSLEEMVKSFSDGKLLKKGNVILPALVADELRSAFGGNADALGREIRRCFGIGRTDALTRRGRATAARFVIGRRIPNAANALEHKVSLGSSVEFQAEIPANTPIPVDVEADDVWVYRQHYFRFIGEEFSRDRERRRLEALESLSMIGDTVLPSLVGPLHRSAYYLPADRTGIMHAHNVVVSALIASAATAGLRPAVQTPMLSGVLADFLEQLIEIGRFPQRRRKNKRDLGRNIEEDILGGSVRVDRSTQTDYPNFSYRPKTWKDDLALANASSMVSELAPLVLYLRHMVEPGNVLIVEEPESHLHPAMQVAFTRQLAAIVRAGVRVIVTTHSEWLLEELANIVQRSALPSAECESAAADIALQPDHVGIWLFEPKRKPKGSAVTEIRLDESGVYPAGYDAVASALHNEWADISGRIESGS